MEFAQRWVDTFMKCMSNVSYKVMVSGIVGVTFRSTRGLRQGVFS